MFATALWQTAASWTPRARVLELWQRPGTAADPKLPGGEMVIRGQTIYVLARDGAIIACHATIAGPRG
jgi:hypothetical protein